MSSMLVQTHSGEEDKLLSMYISCLSLFLLNGHFLLFSEMFSSKTT